VTRDRWLVLVVRREGRPDEHLVEVARHPSKTVARKDAERLVLANRGAVYRLARIENEVRAELTVKWR
jgi:hypothetical protein